MIADATIEINGKEIGLLFGYTAYRRFITAVGLNRELFYDQNDSFTHEANVEILFTAYEANCFEKRAKVELSRDDFSRWLDETYRTEDGKKVIDDLFIQWSKSNDISKLVEQSEKKSQNGMIPTLTE